MLRQQRAAETCTLGGRVGERQRRGERSRESEGGRGGCVACAEASRAAGTQAGRELAWRAECTTRRARALSDWREDNDDWHRPVGWAVLGQAR